MSDLVPSFRLSLYRAPVLEQWPEVDIQRAIVCSLPRRFHALSRDAQKRALKEQVALTGTRWDALLAAVVEHLATRHGLTAPDWVNEPERFLSDTWVLPTTRSIRHNALMFAPAAFLRHGAIPDPRDLDARGGETEEWVP